MFWELVVITMIGMQGGNPYVEKQSIGTFKTFSICEHARIIFSSKYKSNPPKVLRNFKCVEEKIKLPERPKWTI